MAGGAGGRGGGGGGWRRLRGVGLARRRPAARARLGCSRTASLGRASAANCRREPGSPADSRVQLRTCIFPGAVIYILIISQAVRVYPNVVVFPPIYLLNA